MLGQLPPPIHGVTMVNQEVRDLLRQQGNTEVVLLPIGSAATLDDIGTLGLVKLIELGGTILALLWRRIRAGRARIAYLPFAPTGLASLRDALVAAVSRLAAARVLVHVHGQGFSELTQGRSVRARLIRAMIGGCEVIAITQGTAAAAGRSGLFRRVWQVPNGIADPGAGAGNPHDELLGIAYVANMHPAKGINLLLGALRKLADAAVAFRADLIGNGTPFLTVAEVRRRIVDLGLASRVTLHGPLYGAEKYSVLGKSHLFVYPSRHDHAPLVLLEAMAQGLVPIVLDTGGIAEIIGPALANNVLAKSASDARLERLLMQRMAHYDKHRDLLAEHSAIATRTYLAQYTLERFGDRMLRVFAGERQVPLEME